MKFRTIFVLFNIIIVASFAFTFVSPALVLGWREAGGFLLRNWPLALGFLAVLGVLDAFFARNWRVLYLLEREDWPALSSRLRQDIMAKGRYSATRVRLYLNTLVILADLDAAKELEDRIAAKKKRLLGRESLLFAIVRLLRGDASGAESLLSDRGGKGRGAEWSSFYLAFAKAKAGKDAEALSLLSALASSGARAGRVVRGLSAYLARDIAGAAGDDASAEKARSLAEEERTRIAASSGRKHWRKEADAARREIPGVVMARYLDRAEEWIYGSAHAAH
jgi:hypothetical protein